MREFTLGEEAYVRNYVALEKRHGLSVGSAAFAIAVVIGLTVFLGYIDQYLAAAIIAGLSVAFIVYWIKGAEWTARKNYRISPRLHNPIKISVSDAGIHTVTVQGEKMLERTSLSRIEETDEMFFVQHQSGVFLFIPKDILDTEETDLIRQFAGR